MKLVIFSILFVYIYLELCAYLYSGGSNFFISVYSVNNREEIIKSLVTDIPKCEGDLIAVKYQGDRGPESVRKQMVEIMKRMSAISGRMVRLKTLIVNHNTHEGMLDLIKALQECETELRAWATSS
ncbi:conserved protein, unknown function [Hepatocystis sp. ex Piliocolobus tephrosceles]|nr:conserved protein, unknown function [Hepatocystis sp. ex Piliocolobus tephrosceles]